MHLAANYCLLPIDDPRNLPYDLLKLKTKHYKNNILHEVLHPEIHCSFPTKFVFYTIQYHPQLLKERDRNGKTPVHYAADTEWPAANKMMEIILDRLTR